MGEKIRGGIIAIVFFFSFAGSSYSVDASGTNAIQSICTGTIEVMPLGDSITVGKYSGIDTSDGADSDDIGYRKDLWDLLDGDGHTVDFVGTSLNGSTYPFGDPQHEGHNGWRDDQIADNIYDNPGGDNFLNQNPPDVILLHIGTNSLNNDPSDVEDILNEIDQYEGDTGSSVVVIVAKIINQVPYNNVVTQFNNNVQSMVQARADYGSELFLVDMEGGAGINYSIWPGDPAGDMIDNLHPYATGFTKMAGVWKAKLDEILAACDTNEPPVVTNPGTQSDSEGVSVSLQISASDPDPISYSAANLPDGLSINPSSGLISGTISQTAAKNSPYPAQVSVSDGMLFGTTTISFDWNVSDVNVPPAIENIQTQNSAENDDISLQVNATDDDEDTLTFSADGLPPDLSIGTNSGLITGTINYEASNDSPYSVTVTVQDDGNPQMDDTFNFTWNVSNTNRAPELNTPANQHDDEGTTIDPPILITASDPDGDDISFEAISLPPGLIIDQVSATSAEISGTITYDASKGQPSFEYDVQIIVTDDSDPALSDQKNMRWIIDDVNAAPEITDPGTVISHIGEEVAFQIEVNDPDGDNLTFSANGLPPSLSIDPDTGLIIGVLRMWAMDESPYTVKVTVTDDGASPQNSSIVFNWIVKMYEVFMPVIIH